MNYVHLIAVLAIFQFFYFGIMVGRARGQYGVDAPATSGHEMFDRAFRIQMNTLEQLVCFLPALYARSYTQDPAKRGLGFGLSILPTFILLGAAGLGSVLQS
jgi:hypothetical protein